MRRGYFGAAHDGSWRGYFQRSVHRTSEREWYEAVLSRINLVKVGSVTKHGRRGSANRRPTRRPPRRRQMANSAVLLPAGACAAAAVDAAELVLPPHMPPPQAPPPAPCALWCSNSRLSLCHLDLSPPISLLASGALSVSVPADSGSLHV